MIRALILAAMVAAAGHAVAGPDVVGLHLGSVHASPGYNNTNPGAYAVWGNGATVGAYRNSVNRTSVYAGHTWGSGGPVGLSAVLLTGYPLAPVVPALIPSFRVPLGSKAAARLSLILAPKGGSAAHFSIEFNP